MNLIHRIAIEGEDSHKAKLSKAKSDDDMFNVGEAAKYLEYSKHSLNTWRCSNTGPAYVKVRGRIYYRRADLVAFLTASVVHSRRAS